MKYYQNTYKEQFQFCYGRWLQCKKLYSPEGYINRIIMSHALWETNMQIYTDGRVRWSMLNADISRMQWLTLILLSLFMGWRLHQGLEW